MKRLKDEVIVITGSCTGIGKAMAIRFVEEGARVVVHGLERDLGEQLVADLGDESATLHIQDLEDVDCAGNLVQRAVERWGRLDALVNNAAWVATGGIKDTNLERFSRILGINTLAPYALIRSALPELEKSKGSVLNIGSVNAYAGEPNLMAYSVSKGALMTLTRNLGDTLHREHGVRVNQINPGWVLTENEALRKQEHGLAKDWDADLPKAFAPSGRILHSEEIASAAVYWISRECGPISGQVVDLEQYPAFGRNPPKDESTID
ncbi:SDR family oxidoreductase [Verrucomicrobiales bacterium]|nr:SDR family oxidoreductase [Verrucomicrobiales bacterium]